MSVTSLKQIIVARDDVKIREYILKNTNFDPVTDAVDQLSIEAKCAADIEDMVMWVDQYALLSRAYMYYRSFLTFKCPRIMNYIDYKVRIPLVEIAIVVLTYTKTNDDALAIHQISRRTPAFNRVLLKFAIIDKNEAIIAALAIM